MIDEEPDESSDADGAEAASDGDPAADDEGAPDGEFVDTTFRAGDDE